MKMGYNGTHMLPVCVIVSYECTSVSSMPTAGVLGNALTIMFFVYSQFVVFRPF